LVLPLFYNNSFGFDGPRKTDEKLLNFGASARHFRQIRKIKKTITENAPDNADNIKVISFFFLQHSQQLFQFTVQNLEIQDLTSQKAHQISYFFPNTYLLSLNGISRYYPISLT
jgi:hypothetical protein